MSATQTRPTPTPTPAPASDVGDLRCAEVGSALLVYRAGHADPRVRHLAEGVATDPDHTVVVLDLPPDAPAAARAAAADLLGERAGSFRLVFAGEGPSGAATAAATWLADRLGRTVITHEGAVTPVGAHGLFVAPGAGAGWLRFEPGTAPRPESHRFPRPAWDPLPVNGPAVAGSSMVEPLPGGLWIRRLHDDPGTGRHRRTLVECLVVQHEILTVVLGSPGAPALDLGDVATVWERLGGPVRAAVRFVEFGPVGCPDGTSVGQALADRLGGPVTVYAGLPTPPPAGAPADAPAMLPRTVRPDGGPGWFPFADGTEHRPGAATARPRGVRSPVPGARELGPGRFEIAPDAVLEVVPAGLWLRPADGGPTSEDVRAAAVDPERMALVYEAGTPALARRLRAAAEETAARLPGYARERVLVRASRVAAAPAALPPPALPLPPALPPPVAAPVGFAVEASGPDLGRAPVRPAAVPAAASAAPAVPAPGPPLSPAGPVSSVPVPQAVPPPAPAVPVPVLQAVPAAGARAVPPASGLAQERTWMRRAFSAQLNADAAVVGALLSQTPGLRSGSDVGDVVLDLVAVRLFLRGDRAGLHRAVARARPGAHVPLARCVASGLTRLPSFRGAVRAVAPGAAAAAALYERRALVTEWAFTDATQDALPVADGDLDVRIWSSTGRRTALLEGGVPGRVVFGPGTVFRVLGVEPGRVPVVSLRETRDDDDGTPHPFDDIARSGLAGAADRWTVTAPADDAARTGFAPGVTWTDVTR